MPKWTLKPLGPHRHWKESYKTIITLVLFLWKSFSCALFQRNEGINGTVLTSEGALIISQGISYSVQFGYNTNWHFKIN